MDTEQSIIKKSEIIQRQFINGYKTIVLIGNIHISTVEYSSKLNTIIKEYRQNGYLVTREGLRGHNQFKEKYIDNCKSKKYFPWFNLLARYKRELDNYQNDKIQLIFPRNKLDKNVDVTTEELIKFAHSSYVSNTKIEDHLLDCIENYRNKIAINKILDLPNTKIISIWGKGHLYGMAELLENFGFIEDHDMKKIHTLKMIQNNVYQMVEN